MVVADAKPHRQPAIHMKQAEQVPWVTKYESGQLRVTRAIVRGFRSLITVLNMQHITTLVSYIVATWIDPMLARLTGSYAEICTEDDVDGHKVKVKEPISFINNVDPAFEVPTDPAVKGSPPLYNSKEFPFQLSDCDSQTTDCDKNGLHEWVAHFLCLAIKVAYEQPSIVKHVVEECWHWEDFQCFNTKPEHVVHELHTNVLNARKDREQVGQREIKGHENWLDRDYSARVAARLIPDTRAFLMTNDHAVVLFFRGTEPSKLIEWATDAEFDLCVEKGVIHGQVHAGFYEALLYPLDNSKPSIFQDICQALVKALNKNHKKLYITGHSLGGALTSVFSHVLASLSKEARKKDPSFPEPTVDIKVSEVDTLYSRIGAVYTFAGPLAGDRGFAQFMEGMYGGDKPPKMFRISHSSDVVPKVPPAIFGYRHHPLEYFLTFDGFMYNEQQDIDLWKFVEFVAFTRLYWAKIRYNWTIFSPDGKNVLNQNESWVQFRRRTWHTFLRLFFYTGGFGSLILLRDVMRYIPDHFPCDYERKLRVMAMELYKYKRAPTADRANLTTHLMSRTVTDDDVTSRPVTHDYVTPERLLDGHVTSENFVDGDAHRPEE